MMNARMSRRSPRARVGGPGSAWVWLVLVIAVCGMGWLGLRSFWSGGDDDETAVPLATVQRGPLVISVTESGTIQNRQQAVVKSEVEGTSTILFLVPEGIQAKKGDLLVELDSSRLEEQKNQQQITVLNSEAAFIRARENLAVTRSQTESDIAEAELAFKFARQDLTKYLEGEYPRDLQKAESEVTLAKEELATAAEKVRLYKPLVGEGFVTQAEFEAAELAAKRARIALDLAESNLSLLKKYTHQRNLDQLQSDLKQAEEALMRTKRKAAADLVQARAELKAKESEHERQKAKLKKCEEQIAKCKMTAPVDGMVVYATTGRGSWRGNAEPLEEGQTVRERQELIFLPTTSAMMAEVKVHEASLRKVRKDMPVRITVDALPGKQFWGHVGKIALLPDATSRWLNPDLKVYSTEVYIDRDTAALRPGMSCEAEIIVERYEDALSLPVQCVVQVGGKSAVYVPGPDGPEARTVEVGYDNNRTIRIVSGLEEGDTALLAPPLAPSEVQSESANGGEPPVDVPADVEAPAEKEQSEKKDEENEQAPIDPAKLRSMSREERRKFFQNLTPEQREQLRKQAGRDRSGGADARRSRGKE
ncbi:MAG: efflux RND transporter periplasmic adaptor subunit [Planctomycetota bacterium]